MKKRKQKSTNIIMIVIIIAIILSILSVIGYYFMYQDSVVINAVDKSKQALNQGNLSQAIEDLSNIDTRTFADKNLMQTQEIAIKNYENISGQYNIAISFMNASNYGKALDMLNTLHTTNKFLSNKIKDAIYICNSTYPRVLYKKGVADLKASNASSAKNEYSILLAKYPNSPFTKQLGAYLNGTAQGTIKSYNIEISRPMLSGVSSSPSYATNSSPTYEAPKLPLIKTTTTTHINTVATPTSNTNTVTPSTSTPTIASNSNNTSNSTPAPATVPSTVNSPAPKKAVEPIPAPKVTHITVTKKDTAAESNVVVSNSK